MRQHHHLGHRPDHWGHHRGHRYGRVTGPGHGGGYGRRARRPRPFRPAGVLALALLLAMIFGGWEAVVAALVVGGPLLTLLVVGGVAVTAAHVGRAALSRRSQGPAGMAGFAPVPEVPVPRPRPVDRGAAWRGARERFDRLRGEYADYECDPMAVLRLPALADVSVPSTARFVDAFAEAQALDAERQPAAEHAERFAEAVARAERAWTAARDAAERIRLAGLSPAEREGVHRVINLLTLARDSDHHAERVAAYVRARAELAKLERAGHVQLPRPAAENLDAAARGELPARATAPSTTAPPATAPSATAPTASPR